MNKCFCCDCDIETEINGNPMVISAVYGGLFFRSTGNYGSTVFDPIPSHHPNIGKGTEFLQIIICDECIKRKAKWVTWIYNIKKEVTADSMEFNPSV
jgi:hypothetical protein